jgi:Fe-S oxidoreductase
MCGVCSSRCPAGISHPQVAMLARRINGKYLAPKTEHLENRVQEIKDGTFEELLESLMQKPVSEMKELYNTREIEK